MKKEVLKALALKAKNRMIHKKETGNGLHVVDSDIDVKVISDNDDLFYSKVRDLLMGDADIINPMKYLMDESLMLRLDARGREKYLLDTIEKYHRFRKRLESEQVIG